MDLHHLLLAGLPAHSGLPRGTDIVRPLRHVGKVPRLCKNSDVELARRKFVSIALNKKRRQLPVTVGRRKERKQFCAFTARARFHTAWVIFRLRAASQPGPLIPQEQTSGDWIGMSVSCHYRKSARLHLALL